MNSYKKRIFKKEYSGFKFSGFFFSDLPKDLENNDIIDLKKRGDSYVLEIFRIGPISEEEENKFKLYKELKEEFEDIV